MALPTPSTPYTLGAVEAAGVTFVGAFLSALAVVGETVEHAALIGGLAAAVTLGYHAYQSS